MEQFDIIGALRTAATTNGWKFDFAIDDRNQDFNIVACNQPFAAGENILLAAVRYTPQFSGAIVSERTFQVLLMLGRKFDPSGENASLDETSLQKYDRRLFELQGQLENFIGAFKCDNNLDVIPSNFSFAKNLFDTNIDFVMCSNIQFIQ